MGAPAETILRVDRVSKLYARREAVMRKRLSGFVGRALAGMRPPEIDDPGRHEFWALNDVSFELRRGEALGIIGLNGSGKTTLLRILAGQILPDRGEVRISGPSAAMIDLQAGFQPLAPGRRNIYLRAAALGFAENETDRFIGEIIAFSELGDAIDAPMASYSSGMKMRLAFSVMAMVQPDILFIDEVLAVGDFRFRQKCLARIREMRERSAFVFVSHSMGDVSRFCDRAIVLHKGRIHFEGQPKEAIEIYESMNNETPTADTAQQLFKAMGPVFSNQTAISDVEHYWCDESGAPIEKVNFNNSFRLAVAFRPTISIRNLIIGVPVWNINSFYATGLSTEITLDKFDVEAGQKVQLMLEIAGGVLNPGTIKSMLTILDGSEFLLRRPNPDLVITGGNHPTWGAVTVPHAWRRIDEDATSVKDSSPLSV